MNSLSEKLWKTKKFSTAFFVCNSLKNYLKVGFMIHIAVASGKGGTGKTTLSVNLATILSEKYNYNKTVLADLDVEEPNSGLFLDGKLKLQEVKYRMVPEWNEEKCTLCKRCANVCEFNALAFLGFSVLVFPELCHSCYACSELCPENALPMKQRRMGELKHYEISDKLDFIESRLDIGVEQAVPLIKLTRDYVKETFDNDTLVIYDAPPGTSCPVIEAVKKCENTILVTEPTPFGFNDLKLAVETMQELGNKFGVVINRSDANDKIIEDYCNGNNIELYGKIPFMREAAEAYSKGKLLVDEIPVMRKYFETIAERII